MRKLPEIRVINIKKYSLAVLIFLGFILLTQTGCGLTGRCIDRYAVTNYEYTQDGNGSIYIDAKIKLLAVKQSRKEDGVIKYTQENWYEMYNIDTLGDGFPEPSWVYSDKDLNSNDIKLTPLCRISEIHEISNSSSGQYLDSHGITEKDYDKSVKITESKRMSVFNGDIYVIKKNKDGFEGSRLDAITHGGGYTPWYRWPDKSVVLVVAAPIDCLVIFPLMALGVIDSGIRVGP